MRRLLVPLLILLGIALAVTAAWHVVDRMVSGRAERRGGAEVVAQTRPLAPFSQVAVDGLVDVTLVQGPVEAIRIEAQAKKAPGVRADVADGALVIDTSDSGGGLLGSLFGGSVRPARVVVTFRSLDRLRLAGAVKVKADRIAADSLAISVSGATALVVGQLDAKSLTVAGSGGVKADIAGRVTEQRLSISGAADYRAPELASERAEVSVSGAGKVIVNVAKSLDVRISGAGSVDYLGSPQVKEDVSGAGRVRRRETPD